jgi:undecaprenyl-diphosphatase
MEWLFSALMGIVQGLSEFLPVSSSGHLIVAEKLLSLLGYQQGGSTIAFYVMLHMGTLLAVAVVFWKDWIQMILHPVKNNTLLLLFIASLPALLVKVLLGDWVDGLFTGWFLGISFLITAAFLAIIELLGRIRVNQVKKTTVDLPVAVTMGVFQGIALLPGVSRSGSTLLGGVLSDLNRKTAAKFSFMMSAPAILGSFLAEGKDAVELYGFSSLFGGETLIGLAFAAVSGYLAIRFMLKLIESISFYKFALYVAIVGILVIVFQLTGFAGFPPLALPGTVPVI